VLLGDLDPHDAQLEAGIDQLARNAALLVHPRDQWPDLLLRELPHLVPEHALVLGQVGEREAARSGVDVGHRNHLGQR
jgi:hypothetical protein